MKRQTRNSEMAFARAKKIFPGGVNSPVRAFNSVDCTPFIVSHAEGPYLYDLDENRYVDYVNSWGPLVLGHAHPSVVEAIQSQASLGSSYGASCELEPVLGEMIKNLMPGLEMLRFVNSGTEAAMAVLRLARAFTGKSKIIKFHGCYHGHVDSLLVSAGSGAATQSMPDSAGVTAEQAASTLLATYNDLNSVEQIFNNHKGQIAALIIEPVVGNAGFIRPQEGFLQELRKLCTDNSALLILDEVMTGFRVGLGGAQSVYGVKPDLTMLGKVIGGGLPVGAFGGSYEIMKLMAPLGPVYQAGTLSGNPLAMAAGIATLKEWSKPGVFETVAALTSRLCEAFEKTATEAGIDLQVDHLGSMFGYFFTKEKVTNFEISKRTNSAHFKKFFKAMLDRGVYFAQSQYEAGFMSYAHQGEAIEHTLTMLKEVFSSWTE